LVTRKVFPDSVAEYGLMSQPVNKIVGEILDVAVPGTDLPVTLQTQVGHAYDESTVAKDVRSLWSLGRFSDVTSIQRLSTVGGLAPTDGCDAAHISSIAQVPYTAQYVFYKAKTRGAVKVCGG